MRQTIFKRLFFTYGITLILGFGILAILLLQLFNQYFIETKKELLMEQGKKIGEELVLGLYTGRINQSRLYDDLQVLDTFLDARIWLVDNQGIIFGVSASGDEKHLRERISDKNLLTLYQGKMIDEKGTLGGKLEEQSLTVGYPYYFNNVFRGGILIHASLPEVQRTFADIYKITIWAMLFSGLIAYGILYFQVKKISRPLKEISAAAKVIAGGELHKRLEINTHDEIEDLANSFNDMAESLEKIEENRRNLVADISHDLRSPMTLIQGFIQGILDGTIPRDQHEHYLHIVLAESKRLIKMTNNLLELNQMQQGKVELKNQVFELNEAIRRNLISFETPIREKNLEVGLSFYQEPVKVFTDPSFLDRILTNLLDNAVKFTSPGNKISIKTSEHKQQVWVEIMNTGVTMNQQELRKIWDRFHKGDASRGEFKSGFGLGLTIVKEMIGHMGEKIWAESDDNQVKITFTLTKV